jgi:hypothetical protein
MLLKLGIWSFFGAWSLEFGAYRRQPLNDIRALGSAAGKNIAAPDQLR